MKKMSKILTGIAVVSGITAIVINKIGSSKKDEPSFENTMELLQSDVENLSYGEFVELFNELKKREISPNLSLAEKTEYLRGMSEFSAKVQKTLPRFVESGELSDEYAHAIHQLMSAARLCADGLTSADEE